METPDFTTTQPSTWTVKYQASSSAFHQLLNHQLLLARILKEQFPFWHPPPLGLPEAETLFRIDFLLKKKPGTPPPPNIPLGQNRTEYQLCFRIVACKSPWEPNGWKEDSKGTKNKLKHLCRWVNTHAKAWGVFYSQLHSNSYSPSHKKGTEV